MKTKFWQLVEESVIMQGAITIMTVGTLCALYLMGKEVPQLLGYTTTTVLGYYFGQKKLKKG